MFLYGSHLSLFILTPAAEQEERIANGCKFFAHCLKTFHQAHQTSQTGLTSSYIGVAAGHLLNKTDEHLKHSKLNEWHQLPPSVVTHVLSASVDSNHSQPNVMDKIFNELQLSCFTDSSSSQGNVDVFEEISGLIHSLLDNIPASMHGDNRYSVMDVYWLVPNVDLLPSPDCVVGFYGALLRLQKWHNAHIHLITSSSPDLHCTPSLCVWQEGLGSLVVCGLSEWEPPEGVVWRGSIHCSEHKVCKQASHVTLSFPGFCLKLLPIEVTPISLVSPHANPPLDISEVANSVGLNHFHPTHLEVLQMVDMATFPLFWLSPIQCKLTLTADATSSLQLFHELLTSDKDSNNAGLIMCLCTESHDYRGLKASTGKAASEKSSSHKLSDNRPIRNKTTAEWVEFVQGLEGESVVEEFKEEPPAPLLAYGTGPLLLATPTSLEAGTMSCDAWFLWKPDMINTKCVSQGLLSPEEVAEDEDEPCGLSPLYTDATASKVLKELQERITKKDRSFVELDTSPSNLPELKALKTYEWIQRKMIRRITTPDLMFGHMVAPPPRDVTSQLESLGISDVLNCFTDQGAPMTSELSPITMTGSSRLTKVHVPDLDVTYNTIIASTPSSKRQYHGVSYCLTNEDSSIDAKLTKIQQRYLFSERASHCNPVVTPKAERAKQQARRMRGESVTLNSNKEETTETSTATTAAAAAESEKTVTPNKKATPQTKRYYPPSRAGIILSKSPVIEIRKVSQKTALPKRTSFPTLPRLALKKEGSSSSLPNMAVELSSKAAGYDREKECIGEVRPADGEVSASEERQVRRSPRKNKWRATATEDGRHSKLGRQVVGALKKRGMPRSHPCFRKCWARLFAVSKSFLKDMDGGMATKTEEIKRVVELNVQNVVKFELEKHNKTVGQS